MTKKDMTKNDLALHPAHGELARAHERYNETVKAKAATTDKPVLNEHGWPEEQAGEAWSEYTMRCQQLEELGLWKKPPPTLACAQWFLDRVRAG